jgi:hypothetical protein
MLVDEAGYLGVGEQHGSRQAGIGSTKALIKPSHHVKEKDRFAGFAAGVTGDIKVVAPLDPARRHAWIGKTRSPRR